MPESRVRELIAACGLAFAAAGPSLGQSDPLSEPFPAVFRLADLDGAIGFRLDGVDADDQSGYFVASAGDVNGDGIDDLIIGARYADPGGRDRAGETYVVFGRGPGAGGFPPAFELAGLDGVSGFRLDGIDARDYSGSAVGSAGDVNGDGIDDLIIGARYADPGGRSGAGETYVVFGRDTAMGGFPAAIRLSDLDGTIGLRVDGVASGDWSGFSVAPAGDVNGDGIDDVIIGARGADPVGRSQAGVTYVLFGRDAAAGGFPAAIQLADLDGTNGFRLEGIRAFDESGWSVASAGDVNGDGIDDVIIGAPFADAGGFRFLGESYVVFGRDTAAGGFPAAIQLADLDGTNGFRLDGVDTYDWSGSSVASAGDVNGDGIDDVIVGAPGVVADPYTSDFAGESYVVYGRDAGIGGFPAAISLAGLDGATGFRLEGDDALDGSGRVAPAGDVNGDSLVDLVIGAGGGDPGGRDAAGETYVVFGRDAATGGFPAVLQLADLDGDTGFRLEGINARDFSGAAVASAGDVNGDGFDDIVVGANGADPDGLTNAGTAFVVFGRQAIACLPDLDADGTLTIFDFLTFQNLFDLMDPRADFDGDGEFSIFDFLAFQNAFDTGCS